MSTILFSLCIELLSYNRNSSLILIRTSRTSWKSCTQMLWVWLRDYISVQKVENDWGWYPQQPQVSTCVQPRVCTHMHPDTLELACMHMHTHMSMHIAHTHKCMNEDVVVWHTWIMTKSEINRFAIYIAIRKDLLANQFNSSLYFLLFLKQSFM